MTTQTRTRLLRIIRLNPSGVDIKLLAANLADTVGMRNLAALESGGLIEAQRPGRPGRGHLSIYRPAGGAR